MAIYHYANSKIAMPCQLKEKTDFTCMYLHCIIKCATSWQNLLLPYANNIGADQPAHPCNLISTFVVHYLDSIIPLIATAIISRLSLVSGAEQACLSLTWSETPKTCFIVTWLKLYLVCYVPNQNICHETSEPRHEKTCLQGFRPGLTQTG